MVERPLRSAAVWLVLACLLVSGGSAFPQQIPISSYMSDDGLAHPQVWTVYQDQRGYLWIGTTDGVNRFDGKDFSRITIRDGLRNQTTRAIIEDRQGNLWFGTDNGLSSYDGKKVRPWGPATGAPEGTIWGVARDAKGRLWFATQYFGVVRYDGRFRAFGKAEGLASDYAYGILADRSGHLWVGHRGQGLSRCTIAPNGNLTSCRRWGAADGLNHLEIHALAEDPQGAIWAGTRGGGISRIDENGVTSFTTADGLSHDDVYALMVNGQGELVIGTLDGGLDICSLPDLTECRYIGIRQGLADDGVICLMEDRAHDLWVGSENGLSRIGSEQLVSFTTRSGLPHHTVYGLASTEDGSVWIGTLGGLALAVEKEGELTLRSWEGGIDLPGVEVWDLEVDDEGRLWVATEKGLCEFDPEQGCTRLFDQESGLASSDLISLGKTASGKLLVTSLKGLSIVDPSSSQPSIRNVTLEEGLAGSLPYGVTEDARGRIWLGTDRGLSVVDGSRVRSYTHADGLPVDDLSALLTDSSGRIWIGSNGGGLVGFDPPPSLAEASPAFETYGADRGVPEGVAALELAADGELWLGTNDGVYRFDPKRGRARLAFDKDSGLIGNEVNVMTTDHKGRLWTGVVGGVTVWNPETEEPDPPRPSVRIEEFRAFSGPRWRQPFSEPLRRAVETTYWLEDETPELGHQDNSFRIGYQALMFRERGRLQFQTKLEGFEDQWGEPTSEDYKEFTNLDPGKYRFLVRASIRAGQWGPPASLGFTIQPAWWQRPWFAVFVVVATILLLGGGYRARTAAINRRNRELALAIDERTEDLRRYTRALEEHSHALDRANERIRQSDRVKSEFLTNMSHELRTPLNAIIGFSEVLASRLEDRLDKREANFLENIQSSGRYLLIMINNLLDLSKIEAGRMQLNLEAVYVPSVIEEICGVVRGYATQKGIEIETHFDSTVQSVETDVGKLEQILINLLSNAVKFSPSSEKVVVEVEADDTSRWILIVRDRGPGIEEKDLELIFEEFSQAKGKGTHPGGTGLGLTLVRRFVTILDGRIEVKSEPGKGSEFRISFPRKPKPSPDPSGRDSVPGRSRILVAGTNTQLGAFTELLEEEGFTPVQAHDHHEMIRYAREIRPAAAVIAIEVESSETWGRIVALKEELVDLDMGVIVCVFEGTRLTAAFGADDWLLLPERPENVAQAILQQGRPSLRLTVICVSDRTNVIGMIERALDHDHCELIVTDSPNAAVEAVSDETNSCFVVDLCPEGRNGIEVAHRIQHDRRARHVPMIIIAEPHQGDGWVGTATRLEGYDAGATWEYLALLTHEIVRRRSSLTIRRSSSIFE